MLPTVVSASQALSPDADAQLEGKTALHSATPDRALGIQALARVLASSREARGLDFAAQYERYEEPEDDRSCNDDGHHHRVEADGREQEDVGAPEDPGPTGVPEVAQRS